MPHGKLTPGEFVRRASLKNPDFEVVGEYKGRESPIRIRCRKCGRESTRTASTLLARKISCRGCRSVAVARPDLLAEWDYGKNGSLDPADATIGSTAKVWWICPACGHSYAANICNRARGSRCPECARRAAARARHETCMARSGSLAESCPPAVEFWDASANGGRTPDDVTPRSGETVFWRCPECGHAFARAIGAFARHPGCPECGHGKRPRRPRRPRSILSETSPLDAQFWDAERNGRAASEVSLYSSERAAWRCPECGHAWEQTVESRARSGTGCAACGYMRKEKARIAEIDAAARGRKKTPEEREEIDGIRKLRPARPLAARLMLDVAYPDIAAEWDYEANAPLRPSAVYPTSSKKRAWVCPVCGHKWLAKVSSRTLSGNGCPRCAQLAKAGGRR